MRDRASTPCPEPDCPELTNGGRCPIHRRQVRRTSSRVRRAMGDSSMSAYSTREWQTNRAKYLAQHPLCIDCTMPATQPDHVPPRRILIALNINDVDAWRWLRPRCISCHSRKTRLIDDSLLKRLQLGEDALLLANEAMAHDVFK